MSGVLAINGGDGTVAAILGALLESKPFVTPPLIALLPGGTANMSAGDVGLRGSLNKAVRTSAGGVKATVKLLIKSRNGQCCGWS